MGIKLDMGSTLNMIQDSEAYIRQAGLACVLAGIAGTSLASSTSRAGNGDGGHSKGNDSSETQFDGGYQRYVVFKRTVMKERQYELGNLVNWELEMLGIVSSAAAPRRYL